MHLLIFCLTQKIYLSDFLFANGGRDVDNVHPCGDCDGDHRVHRVHDRGDEIHDHGRRLHGRNHRQIVVMPEQRQSA